MHWGTLQLAFALGLALNQTGDVKDTKTAETTKPAAAIQVKPAAKLTPASYLLGAEDVINIIVVGFPNLSTTLTVPPDGNLSLPLLEPFSVTGLTTSELTQKLTEKWRKFVVNPSVTVSLAQKRRESVLFYGFVSRPGPVEYRPTLRLMEALAEAGGASLIGDLTKVTLTHKSGEKQILDLSHPETKGGSQVDILLEPEDVLYVPERRTQVNVIGELNRPGSLDYKENMTVLDAINGAGNVKLETADLAAAILTHDSQEIKLDLDALLRHGNLALNIKLSAGDSILIPEIRNRTYVFGAVGAPGYYNFKPGDRVMDALRGVGGPTREADLGKINVIHMARDKANTPNANGADTTNATGKTNNIKDKTNALVTKVDINKVLRKGDLSGNIALEPGDVLFVPDKKHGFQIQDLFGVLSGFNIINSALQLFGGR